MKHNIVLKGYGAYLPTTPSKLLCLGTAESYGVEQLHITPGADWENLLIKATFHPPSGDSVVVVLGEDGVIDVPPEATAVAAGEYNPGVIVFSGVSEGVQRISANLAYTVIGHAPVEGKESEPTPSQWEQLAEQYQSKVDKQQGSENAGKILGIGEDGLVKPVEQTGGGTKAGVTFTPEVSEEGVISWTNDGGLPNPEPVDIKGDPFTYEDFTEEQLNALKGKDGGDYVLTEADKAEIAEQAAQLVKVPEVEIPDKLPNPNALTFTGAVEGTYDGSAPLTVEIPQGGAGGKWKKAYEIITTEEVSRFGMDVDIKGEAYIFFIAAPSATNTENKETRLVLNNWEFGSLGKVIYTSLHYTRRYVHIGHLPDGFIEHDGGFGYSNTGIVEQSWTQMTVRPMRDYFKSNIIDGVYQVGYASSNGVFGVGSKIVVYVRE